MKKKKKNNKNVLEKYKDAKTKGNVANTGMKSLVDIILGAAVGAGLGAASGRAAVPLGLVLIAGSHYFDEETGVIRVAGAATVAYGIGKAIDNKKLADENAVNGITLAGEADKAKTRLGDFKDEILAAFYLDKLFKKGNSDGENQAVGAVDISALDAFEQFNHNQAVQYQLEEGGLDDNYPELEGYDDEDELDDFSVYPDFSVIDEDPDLTNI